MLFKEEYFFSFVELVEWFEKNIEKIEKLNNREISFYLLFNEKKQCDIVKLVEIILNCSFEKWKKITNFLISLITAIERNSDFRKISSIKNFKYIENNLKRI